MSLLCRLKNLVHKGVLKEKDLERIVIIPKEQEPCEDCISRAEVMKLSQHKPEYGDMIYAFDVSILPSVQPKPKTDVLDKIRAEIVDTGAYEQEVNGKTEFLKGINYCLGIIDKYKAESEDKE